MGKTNLDLRFRFVTNLLQNYNVDSLNILFETYSSVLLAYNKHVGLKYRMKHSVD